MCPSVAAEYLRGPACSHEGECECGTTKQRSFKSKQPPHWGPSLDHLAQIGCMFFFPENRHLMGYSLLGIVEYVKLP